MFNIEVKSSSTHGRGVFATKDFAAGETIEVAPVLVLTPEERIKYTDTLLDWYIFPWQNDDDACVPLGYGMVYNHSNTPNADYDQNYTDRTMIYTALKSIKKGEEITINYGDYPEDPTFPGWMKNMPVR